MADNGQANNNAGNGATGPAGGFSAEQLDTMATLIRTIMAGDGVGNGAGNRPDRRSATPPAAVAAPTNGNTQFRPRDIGYFDPNPDVPPVEVKDTHNIYHNVFSFTNRLQVKAITMDKALLRQNIDSCLLGKADDWFTNQLSQLNRVGLRNDPTGVTEWCNALQARFRDSRGKSLSLLENIRYTVKDARNRRDPADYISSITFNAKNAGIATTEQAQVLLAYKHLDGELRRDLPRPTAWLNIPDLLEELRFTKDNWFDIYGNKGLHQDKGYETKSDSRNHDNRRDRDP